MASYYVWSGATGSANGTSWANAYTLLATATSGKPAGDIFYVAHDHAETTAGAVVIQGSGTVANPIKIICVNRAGSVPPVSADRRATATVENSALGVAINLQGNLHIDGIIFNGGAGLSSGQYNIAVAPLASIAVRLDNCSLRCVNTGGGTNSGILAGNSSGGGSYVELNNTTVSFANILQQFLIWGTFKWRNTPSALLGTIPTTLLAAVNSGAAGFAVECTGVDFSAAGSGKSLLKSTANTQGGFARFFDCKLNAAVTKSVVPAGAGSYEIDFVRCSASGNYSVLCHRIGGLLIEETTIVRTGGASDGTTPIAWKIVTTANCNYTFPFECPPIAIWNDTIGSAVTATVEGIWGGGAVPNDDDVWLDVEYLGDASSPQGSFVNDGKANLLATAAAQTSSSETWGGSTTRFKLNVAFTAQQKGWIYARVKCAKASTTFYIDPLITLT